MKCACGATLLKQKQKYCCGECKKRARSIREKQQRLENRRAPLGGEDTIHIQYYLRGAT